MEEVMDFSKALREFGENLCKRLDAMNDSLRDISEQIDNLGWSVAKEETKS